MLQFTAAEFSTQTKCADVDILDDTVLENPETFSVYLNTTSVTDNPIANSGRIIVDSRAQVAVVTILDNDSVTVGIERESYIVDEGDKAIEICVVLEGELEREVHVSILTVADTAHGK